MNPANRDAEWKAVQASGYFGLVPPPLEAVAKAKKAGSTPPPPQPKHRGVVDLDEAWSDVGEAMVWCAEARRLPDTAPLSGGVLDAWPAWLVDALDIFDTECRAVRMLEAFKE